MTNNVGHAQRSELTITSSHHKGRFINDKGEIRSDDDLHRVLRERAEQYDLTFEPATSLPINGPEFIEISETMPCYFAS